MKDESGSYAVFTKQGSSASQMTAAKVTCTIIVKNSEVRMSRYLDSFTTTQMAQIVVQCGRSSRSSLAKSVRSSFGRTVMGTAI